MVWQRRVATARAVGWWELLEARFPGRVLLMERPRSAWAWVQVVGLSGAAGRRLAADHGGSLAPDPQARQDAAPPLRIGKRLFVAGSRSAAAKMPGVPRLVIPAEQAFGTGHHATTAMLLRQMAAVRGLDRRRVLDLGTGSGILALAARRLGAGFVEAWDNDPVCIRVARSNERRNFKEGRIRWRVRALRAAARPGLEYDLVVANLYSEILISCALSLRSLVGREGMLMTSGILAGQAEEVAGALKGAGFEIGRRLRKGKWVALMARATPHDGPGT